MIYLVEDDPSIRKLVSYALKGNGFEVSAFETGEEMWQHCREDKPELFLLDIMLPGQSGLEILREIREDSMLHLAPVIMLTAKSSEYDKVLGLDSGADDYITKPFGMMELLSRVRAVLRRSETRKDQADLSYGRITISRASHHVKVNGEKVELTLKEFNLLLYLMENEGIRLIEGDESGSIALVLNKREGIFSDLDNRRSLSLMIDRNELMAACYGDYGYSVDSSYMEKGLWHVDPSLDPYGRKEEGIVLPEGERIRILSSNTSNLDKIAIALSSELEKAGVENEIIVLDWASFIERRKDPSSWDIFISAYSRTALPQLKSYLSESNPGWLDDDQALALLEDLNDARSVEDAVRQWKDAQLYLWEIVPAIVPGHYTTVYGIRSDLEGVELAEGFYFQSASLS